MDELISRQEAINALGERPSVYIGSAYEIAQRNQWDTDRLAIETVPAAQPEQRWIPVSERLPEDMQFVLLTVRRLKNEYNLEPFISVGYIGWNQQHWWCAHDGDCEISKVEVIAWMPLPEPYREEER